MFSSALSEARDSVKFMQTLIEISLTFNTAQVQIDNKM